MSPRWALPDIIAVLHNIVLQCTTNAIASKHSQEHAQKHQKKGATRTADP